jgi:prefoldin subunit 5
VKAVSERLKTLEEEYRKGQQMLSELDQRRAEIRDTLLRIAGAIQILKELSADREEPADKTRAVA